MIRMANANSRKKRMRSWRRRRGFLCLAEAGVTFSLSMIIMFLFFFRITAVFHISEQTMIDRNAPFLQALSWSTIEQTATVAKATGGSMQLCGGRKIRFYDAMAIAALKGDTRINLCGTTIDLADVAFDKIHTTPILKQITETCSEYTLRDYKGETLVHIPSTPDPDKFDNCVKYFVHKDLVFVSKQSTTWLIPLPMDTEGNPQLTEQVISSIEGVSRIGAGFFKELNDLKPYLHNCPDATAYDGNEIEFSEEEGDACDCDGNACENGKYCVHVVTGYGHRECRKKGLTPPPADLQNCTGYNENNELVYPKQISNWEDRPTQTEGEIPDPRSVSERYIQSDCNCGGIECDRGHYCCAYKKAAIYEYICQELPCI